MLAHLDVHPGAYPIPYPWFAYQLHAASLPFGSSTKGRFSMDGKVIRE